MAAVVDSSAPIRWTGTPSSGADITSASFTAPADSLLVMCVSHDGDTSSATTYAASDSGGLTWTQRVVRTNLEATAGGASVIFTAPQTTSAARTASVRFVTGGASRLSAKLYVVTGADLSGTPVDSVTASNEGGSGTNNLTTTAVTPGATGLLFAMSTDWNAQGDFQASTDLTQETTTYVGLISVCTGWKAVTGGVSATANLNGGGTGTCQHKWVQIVVREAAGGPAFLAAQRRPILQAVNRASTF